MFNVMKKILIVVDYQKDFYDPKGALYVKDGEKLLPKIAKIASLCDKVIYTEDWHPYNHCSFSENGGIWPVHCVAHTEGASIPLELIKCNSEFVIWRKGAYYNTEEYGAFAPTYDANNHEVLQYIKDYQDKEFIICGIAGDYCVLETLKNLLKLVPKSQVKVFINGIVSIDGGDKLNQFIAQEKLNIYSYDN